MGSGRRQTADGRRQTIHGMSCLQLLRGCSKSAVIVNKGLPPRHHRMMELFADDIFTVDRKKVGFHLQIVCFQDYPAYLQNDLSNYRTTFEAKSHLKSELWLMRIPNSSSTLAPRSPPLGLGHGRTRTPKKMLYMKL